MAKVVQEERKKDESIGSYEIRYYHTSLNFPLVLVSDKSTPYIPVVAYTGFYTKKDSEQMPYIVWRDGDIRIVNDFYQLFQHKWNLHSDTTYLNPENALDE